MSALVLGIFTGLDCRIWMGIEREGLERKLNKVDIDHVSRLLTSSITKLLTTHRRPEAIVKLQTILTPYLTLSNQTLRALMRNSRCRVRSA